MPYNQENGQLEAAVTRVMLLLLSVFSGRNCFRPDTTLGTIFHDMPVIGIIFIGVGIIGLCDTIINDIMPNGFHWRAALSIRHFSLTICGALYLVAAFESSRTGIASSMVPYFVLMSTFFLVNTYFDVCRRFGGWRRIFGQTQ